MAGLYMYMCWFQHCNSQPWCLCEQPHTHNRAHVHMLAWTWTHACMLHAECMQHTHIHLHIHAWFDSIALKPECAGEELDYRIQGQSHSEGSEC